MRFYCRKCCDDNFKPDPCILTVPNELKESKKDIMAGLTKCPFEGLNYNKGVWERNGIVFDAEWDDTR